MTIRTSVLSLALLAACATAPGQPSPGFTWPFGGLATAAQNDAYAQRRGQVELIVKTNHPAIVAEIQSGGGPVLWQAMEVARIPLEDRPARVIQLNGDLGLYAGNPGALVTAIMAYGG